jgi:Domain of unknown function (DUF4402)
VIWRRVALALGALAAAGAPPAGAQNAKPISADAVVVTVGMTITTLSNLAFGSVLKGVATTVAPSQAGAGEWQVSGGANANVNISFTLPTQLVNIQAQPGSTMPISFGATSALWRRANNNPAGATAFNPNVGTVGKLGPPPNPTMYIWIGGTVTPAATAKPGIYRGTVIVSLSY